MPHILADMDTAADAMMGNATSGCLHNLKTTYHAVDALLGHSTTETEELAHEYCDKVSGFLLGNFEYEPSGHGTKQDVDNLITEGDAILNA